MNRRLVYACALIAIVVAIVLLGLILPRTLLLEAWLLILTLLAAFLLIAGKSITGVWRGVLIDERNMISLSRLQVIVWTLLILSALMAAVLANAGQVTNPLDVAIPVQLWLLMGISTASLVGSPLIKGQKREQTAKQEKQPEEESKKAIGVIVENKEPTKASWSDILQGEEMGNYHAMDLSKVQMFFFTLILSVTYGIALASLFDAGGVIREFPDVQGGMNVLMGISHAGYLAHKTLPLTRDR